MDDAKVEGAIRNARGPKRIALAWYVPCRRLLVLLPALRRWAEAESSQEQARSTQAPFKYTPFVTLAALLVPSWQILDKSWKDTSRLDVRFEVLTRHGDCEQPCSRAKWACVTLFSKMLCTLSLSLFSFPLSFASFPPPFFLYLFCSFPRVLFTSLSPFHYFSLFLFLLISYFLCLFLSRSFCFSRFSLCCLFVSRFILLFLLVSPWHKRLVGGLTNFAPSPILRAGIVVMGVVCFVASKRDLDRRRLEELRANGPRFTLRQLQNRKSTQKTEE